MGNDLAVEARVLIHPNLKALAHDFQTISLTTVVEAFSNFIDLMQCERHLSYNQFDEIFGMLVKDTQPYYQLFLLDYVLAVNAFEMFGAIVMLIDEDAGSSSVKFEQKLHCLYDMYASLNNISFRDGDTIALPQSVAIQLLQDTLSGTNKIIGMPEMVASFESLLNRKSVQDKQFIEIDEMLDWIKRDKDTRAYFAKVSSITEKLSLKEQAIEFFQTSALWSDDENDLKLGDGGGSLDKYCEKNALWAKKVQDISTRAWLQENFQLDENTQCLIALKKMLLFQTEYALLMRVNTGPEDAPEEISSHKRSRTCVGIITFSTLMKWLIYLFPSLETRADDRDQLMLQDAEREFCYSTVLQALRHELQPPKVTYDERSTGDTVKTKTYYPIRLDDFAFNFVHRLAQDQTHVVAHTVFKKGPKADENHVMGVLTHPDATRIIQEDFSLLNGKAARALSSFDFLYRPISLAMDETSPLAAFKMMLREQVSEAVIHDDALQYACGFDARQMARLLVRSWPSSDPTVECPNELALSSNLPNFEALLAPFSEVWGNQAKMSSVGTPLFTLSMHESVATAIATLTKHKLRRVYLKNEEENASDPEDDQLQEKQVKAHMQESDEEVVEGESIAETQREIQKKTQLKRQYLPIGVLRSSDFLRFLLKEQAHIAARPSTAKSTAD